MTIKLKESRKIIIITMLAMLISVALLAVSLVHFTRFEFSQDKVVSSEVHSIQWI